MTDAILVLFLLVLQAPEGQGVSGASLNMDEMLATAISIQDRQRFAPVPMESWSPAVGATRNDLMFMAAVEEFAAASPPDPCDRLIAALGRSEWRERDAASRGLESTMLANPGDARWLFRGRRHSDPEVGLRCNVILRRLNPCSTCKGDGKSKNWELHPCWDCDGAGTNWPFSMWD
jgi:hypothetical protein